jgi:hypothetical protein
MQGGHFIHGFAVSLDNSPTQNTPCIAPQDEQYAIAGPLPCDGIAVRFVHE